MMSRRAPPAVALGMLALSVLAGSAVLPAAEAAAPQKVRHGYVDDRYGQLHYATAAPAGRSTKVPLVLLHQSPNSSVEFGPLILEMARDRVVVAPDTPGQGGSDGPDSAPTIQDYAAAIAEGLRGLGYGPDRPVDVVGNHTGALVAAELAVLEPRMVRRLALLGVYVVPKEQYEKAAAGVKHQAGPREALHFMCSDVPRLEKWYASQRMPDAQWVAMLIDGMRPLEKREFGHDAAFRYAAEVRERLPLVTQPVTLLAVHDDVYEGTLASRRYFRDATLVDLPQFSSYAYNTGAAELATYLRKAFD